MIKKALEAMHNSYSPYSNFKVGAAISLKDGTIITGTNIENSSYGLSICAERVALFSVYAKGYRKDDIVSMAIAGENITPPCGACRQVMNELMNRNTPIILVNKKGEIEEHVLANLFPVPFDEVKK